MARHLVLRLDAPLMAFGGEVIDNYGVIRRFPALSMIAGLIGNALGFERYEGDRLQRLQDRLRIASRIERAGGPLQDFQTVRLFAEDEGWMTRGRPEGRNKTSSSFVIDQDHLRRTGETVKSQTHIRYRDFWTETVVTVVLRLEPPSETPALSDLAAALVHPDRPLFLGRKPCLPSDRLLIGEVEGADALDALRKVEPPKDRAWREKEWRGEYLQWPEGEGPADGAASGRAIELCDERNWVSGVHGGLRRVRVLDRGREEAP